MVLTGTYELTIDGKNRLVIPAGVRSALDPETQGETFYIVPGTPITTLRLYPDRYFERYSEERHASLAPSAEQTQFEQVYYSMVSLLEPDNQGRVVLPTWLLDQVGIGKQVTLTGARDHLVIWNRAEHAIFMRQNGPRHSDLYQFAVDKTTQLQAARGAAPPTRS